MPVPIENIPPSPTLTQESPMVSWIRNEIQNEQSEQLRLLKSDTKMHHNTLFIIGALLGNIIAASVLPNYMVYWIAASFFLYVFSPLIMLIPTERKEVIFPVKKDLEGYLHIIEDYGISKNTKTLGHILWNVFFINCQALAVAFCMVFFVDIIFAVVSGFFILSLPRDTSLQVILQSVAIITFYVAIWEFKPYSLHFVDAVFELHAKIKIRMKEAWKIALILGAVSTALALLVVTAMLLPGFVLGEVVVAPNVVNGVSAFPIFLIFLSQLVMVRYLQGVYSKDLVLGLSEKKVAILSDQILPHLSECGLTGEGIASRSPEQCLRESGDLQKLYVQSRMYTQKFHHLFGYLPVYLVVPNFKLILDREALVMLEGQVALDDSLF
ncbi:MAG: hypothetical protein LUO82_05070 [Methanomicrobiales archaeon]|nr:hypothetical protein [Methanomicrobiales archaeon]